MFSSTAADPAICGVDIEVPLKHAHPLPSPGQVSDLPTHVIELRTLTPTEVRSGLTATSTFMGPWLLNPARMSLFASTWMDPVSASFGRVTLGHPTSVTITLSNPTGSSETFSISVTKFTPDTFGGTVPSIYDAGTLSPGDDRIAVPAGVTVPANGSITMTVRVNGGHRAGEVIQGWINLDGPGANDLHLAYYALVGH